MKGTIPKIKILSVKVLKSQVGIPTGRGGEAILKEGCKFGEVDESVVVCGIMTSFWVK